MNKYQANRILGAILIPDKEIERYDKELGFFKIKFSKETIKEYKGNFDKKQNIPLTKSHSKESFKSFELSNSFLISDNNKSSIPESYKNYPIGTWLVEYTFIDEEEFLNLISSDLIGFSVELEYSITDENGKTHHLKDNFERMNKLSELLSINIFIRGGSTGGAGRNEHGEAHFEIHQKNSNKNIGKIFMPKLNRWSELNFKEKLSLLTIEKGADIPKREKKAFVKWLEKNENENLKRCYNEWNRINKDNNQAILI
ncbi:MAG: hypothetical protein V3V28_08555 [Polaribacter sp.]|uniref:hypothetical protein n=1 Tax=Polaribacter sp. TaxID=1920175 RepID=UPI002F34F3AF